MAQFTPNPPNSLLKNHSNLIVNSFALQAVKARFFVVPVGPQIVDEAEAFVEGNLNRLYSDFYLPVYDILTFGSLIDPFTYETNKGVIITLPALNLTLALIDVSMTKNIITTPIQGRNGTIKEYVSDGDFSINIKGVLAGFGQEVFPEDDMILLRKYLTAPAAIPVTSGMLNDVYGIKEIVITNFQISQNEGMRNVVPFEIQALSETPFEIKTKVS